MWLSASRGKNTILAWWIYWSHSQFLFSPHGIQVSLEISRDLLFVSHLKKKGADTWVTAEVFNINSLSSRTQLGHLYLTHSIGVRWICIFGVLECAIAQKATGWNQTCTKRQWLIVCFTIQSVSSREVAVQLQKWLSLLNWQWPLENSIQNNNMIAWLLRWVFHLITDINY